MSSDNVSISIHVLRNGLYNREECITILVVGKPRNKEERERYRSYHWKKKVDIKWSELAK
jgi:hypothetical protein